MGIHGPCQFFQKCSVNISRVYGTGERSISVALLLQSIKAVQKKKKINPLLNSSIMIVFTTITTLTPKSNAIPFQTSSIYLKIYCNITSFDGMFKQDFQHKI